MSYKEHIPSGVSPGCTPGPGRNEARHNFGEGCLWRKCEKPVTPFAPTTYSGSVIPLPINNVVPVPLNEQVGNLLAVNNPIPPVPYKGDIPGKRDASLVFWRFGGCK